MNKSTSKAKSWLALIAMIVTLFVMQWSCLITAGLAPRMMDPASGLGLTPSQFGMLCNMPFLAGVLFGIIMGNLGDKYGIKKVMTIGVVIFVIGAFWRAYSHTFVTLMLSSLCMGFGTAVLNANSTKGIRMWFQGPMMGTAMGLYVTGASLGAGISIAAGPAFASYSQAYFVCGIMGVVALIVWVILYQTHPNEIAERGSESVGLQAFGTVMKDKNVWFVSFMILFIFGCSTTAQTYLNAGFGNHGASDVQIGTLSILSSVFVSIGSIFGPVVVTRFKRFRPIMSLVFILAGICVALAMIVPFGILTDIGVALFGLFMGTSLAMGKAVPALLPNIAPQNLGAVGGLHSTLQNIGAWFLAGGVIAPIAMGIDATQGHPMYVAIYIGAGCCMVVAILFTLLLPKDVPTTVRPEE